MEREISFRTEQGLYYSYFKQLVRAPSLAEGLDQLRADNMTESGHAINILERCGTAEISAEIYECRTCCRFNVYQEVVLAAIYKFYDFRQPPILFYVYAVFCLQVRPRATCHNTRDLCSACRVSTSAASTCWPGASRAPGWPACSPPPWSPPAGDT